MNKFRCEICGLEHKLETLLEFPQPEIISRISRGEIEGNIDLFSKHGFLVNKEFFIIESELSIVVSDYDDQLDMLVWVEVTREEFDKKIKLIKKGEKTNFQGKLNRPIPFYADTDRLIVEISLDIGYNEKPSVLAVHDEGELRHDFYEGITLKKLQQIMERLYHWDE